MRISRQQVNKAGTKAPMIYQRYVTYCVAAIVMAAIFMAVIFMTVFLMAGSVAIAADALSSKQITITKVTDGDSLRAGDIRIRLHGIDAPEMRQICEHISRYNCGEAARDYLANAIGENATLTCQHLDTDRYGRYVMRCFYRGIDINAAMVRSGWAVAYRRYSRDYIADETDAKSAKRGLWAGKFEMPEAWRRKN